MGKDSKDSRHIQKNLEKSGLRTLYAIKRMGNYLV